MDKMYSPQEVGPELIGKIITVQVFRRDPNVEGSIKHETLQKYVGKLMHYGISEKEFAFCLEGSNPLIIRLKSNYVEIYKYSTTRYVNSPDPTKKLTKE